MKTRMRLLRIALAAGFVGFAGVAARAQPAWTPREIQSLIADGQAQAALSELNAELQAHPGSAVAWYLTAEAQDEAGNLAASRAALAKAEQIAPGLPFAKAGDVAALQAHLDAQGAAPGINFSPVALVIGGMVVLFVLFRMLGRRRAVYRNGYGGFAGPPAGGLSAGGPFPYGPGGGAAYGPGTGVGGALLGGLAAGAGFAAGERIIDDLTGANRGDGMFGQDPAVDPNFGVPARDDGLLGSPDWNAGTNDPGLDDNGGGFDPDNNW
jgi:hypothetical protein